MSFHVVSRNPLVTHCSVVGKDGRQVAAQLLTAITGGWSGRILWQIPRSGSWTPAEKIRKARKPRINLYRLAGQMCPTLLQMSQRMQESLSPRHLVLSCPASSENFVSDCCMEPFHSWSFTLPLCEYRPYLQASLCEQRGHALKSLQVEAKSRSITICSTLLRPVMLCSRIAERFETQMQSLMTYHGAIWIHLAPFGAIMWNDIMPLVAISICHQGSAESWNRSWSSFTSCKDPDGRCHRWGQGGQGFNSKHVQTCPNYLASLASLASRLESCKACWTTSLLWEIAPLTLLSESFTHFESSPHALGVLQHYASVCLAWIQFHLNRRLWDGLRTRSETCYQSCSQHSYGIHSLILCTVSRCTPMYTDVYRYTSYSIPFTIFYTFLHAT